MKGGGVHGFALSSATIVRRRSTVRLFCERAVVRRSLAMLYKEYCDED